MSICSQGGSTFSCTQAHKSQGGSTRLLESLPVPHHAYRFIHLNFLCGSHACFGIPPTAPTLVSFVGLVDRRVYYLMWLFNHIMSTFYITQFIIII